jgi:predicted nuclease with TOPRIM domain
MADDHSLLLKMMEQLRDDFREEREASRQSRQTLHKRMDEVADDIGTIRGDIRILGEVDGQVRGEVQALSRRVDNAQPTLEEWRRIRAIGIGLVGLLALGGMSVGAALAWAGEGVVSAIRHWLRIG